jgi:hypothetical protein
MHWSACFLPDDYPRKLKQDLAESMPTCDTISLPAGNPTP